MLRRFVVIAALLVVVLVVAAYMLVLWPLRDPHPAIRLGEGTLAIRDATVYSSPDHPPLEHASIVIKDGFMSCNRCFVTAGFWNAHVHFTEPKWANAAFKSASMLNAQPGGQAFEPRVYDGGGSGVRPAGALRNDKNGEE